jgi:hypothetical protein
MHSVDQGYASESTLGPTRVLGVPHLLTNENTHLHGREDGQKPGVFSNVFAQVVSSKSWLGKTLGKK